jgi:hypothetical protein
MSTPSPTGTNDDRPLGRSTETRSIGGDAETWQHQPGPAAHAANPTPFPPTESDGSAQDPPVSGHPEPTGVIHGPGHPAQPQGNVLARQQQRFGGMKIGSAFFGWLTATGMAVLLISVLAAAGVAFGVATSQTVDQAVQESQNATATAQTVGLVGAITLLVILFVAYYCGGYVAGRMARFHGARQGLAVWLWGIAMAVIIAGIAWIAGSQYDVLARLNLPRIPVNEGDVTAVGLIAIGAALLTGLVGALLGGLVGMRFHRKVDAADLDAPADSA